MWKPPPRSRGTLVYTRLSRRSSSDRPPPHISLAPASRWWSGRVQSSQSWGLITYFLKSLSPLCNSDKRPLTCPSPGKRTYLVHSPTFKDILDLRKYFFLLPAEFLSHAEVCETQFENCIPERFSLGWSLSFWNWATSLHDEWWWWWRWWWWWLDLLPTRRCEPSTRRTPSSPDSELPSLNIGIDLSL